MNQEKLGSILKQARRGHQMDQRLVGRKIGINQSTLSKIERGILSPTLDNFFTLCELYKLDPVNTFKKVK